MPVDFFIIGIVYVALNFFISLQAFRKLLNKKYGFLKALLLAGTISFLILNIAIFIVRDNRFFGLHHLVFTIVNYVITADVGIMYFLFWKND